MKIIAFNGSPRKNGNTATLLKEALDGAADAGASVELVHLYSLNFKGCTSCFKCKKLGGDSYGTCAMKDDLTPFLRSISQYDGLILGTPVYFGVENGETRSFLERLMFPFLTYTPGYASLFQKKMPTALVYTMNLDEERMKEMGYPASMERTRSYLDHVLGHASNSSATTPFSSATTPNTCPRSGRRSQGQAPRRGLSRRLPQSA